MRLRNIRLEILRCFAWAVGGVLLSQGAPAPLQAQSPVLSCAELGAKALPGAINISAEAVEEGGYALPPRSAVPPGMNIAGVYRSTPNPAFCRIKAVLKPTLASHIRTEVWLPRSGWNGKFIGVGNFGWGGALPYAGMLAGVEKGYATAGNDTGHDTDGPQGYGGKFLMGNPEALIDYAYRANHEMTVAAKALIASFYGTGPRRSYWIGCSLGGLQGLIEAKRFPEDYDGIVAGAPPNPLTLFNAAQLWPNWLIARDPEMAIPLEKYPMIHAAVLKACASPVGQKLGYVENPAQCAFDPKQIQCRKGNGPNCLTAKQVQFLQLAYRGPVNPRTQRLIFPGPAKGSELELTPFVNGKEFVNGLDLYRYAAFQDPNWSSFKMDWDKDVNAAVAKVGPLMHVDDDLTAFSNRGGRLLLYVGWNDYHNPLELADYMKRLHARIGEKGDHYVRMFTIAGMNHCAGGAGCDTWDKIEAIDRWVDRKAGRQPMMSARIGGGAVVRTHPLCFYPDVPTYKGTGSIDDAANFECKPN